MRKLNYKWGPREFIGLYWSIKLDRTFLHHAAISVLMCLIHPVVAIIFYLSKELREGTGYKVNGVERCVGFDKCLQGFGLDDYTAVLLVSVPWWIWLSRFTLFTFHFSFNNLYEVLLWILRISESFLNLGGLGKLLF